MSENYKYEKETLEIDIIRDHIRELKEEMEIFSSEIETEDVDKMLKQITTLEKTATRIFKHLSSLNTAEDLSAYTDKLLMEAHAKKVCQVLQHANFLEPIACKEAGITNEDLVAFQKYYDVRLSECGYGDWRWLQVWYNGHHITPEEMVKLGIRKEVKACVKIGHERQTDDISVQEKEKTKEGETICEDNPYDRFGWVLRDGTFYPSDFGTHERSAYELIEKLGFKEDYKHWCQNGSGLHLCRDYLIQERGFVLLHNPSGYGNALMTNAKEPTKAQKETLYDYFLHNGDNFMANQMFEEEMER